MKLSRLLSEAMHPKVVEYVNDIKSKISEISINSKLEFEPTKLAHTRFNRDIDLGKLKVGHFVYTIVLDITNDTIGMAKWDDPSKEYSQHPPSNWYNIDGFIKALSRRSTESKKFLSMSNVDKFMQFIKKNNVEYSISYGPKEQPPKPSQQVELHDDDEFSNNEDRDRGPGPHKTQYFTSLVEYCKRLITRLWKPINDENINEVLQNIQIKIRSYKIRDAARKSGYLENPDFPQDLLDWIKINNDGVYEISGFSTSTSTTKTGTMSQEVVTKLLEWRQSIIKRVASAMKK
jgi:hypothetical protein